MSVTMLKAHSKSDPLAGLLDVPRISGGTLETSMTSNKLMVLDFYCNLLPLAGLIHQFDRS